MPGILLASGRQQAVRQLADLSGPPPGPRFSLHELSERSWLRAGVWSRLSGEEAVHEDGDGFSVLFDGYLADVVGASGDLEGRERPARVLAELYQQMGNRLFNALRGSFTLLLVDDRQQRAILVSDRLGSRPCFMRSSPGGLLVAPTVHGLAGLSDLPAALDAASVVEFVLTGAYRSRYTLFQEITSLPQAGMLMLDAAGHAETERYWRIHFEPTAAGRDDLVEECDALLRAATRRNLPAVSDSVLGLSGGLDSRVVLGYLRDAGEKQVPVTVFWEEGTSGDDAEVAKNLADRLGLPITSFTIKMDNFLADVTEAVMKADCGAEVIDSAPLSRLWEPLGSSFRHFINGDECFGWHGSVSSVRGALSEIRWYHLDQAARVREWLAPGLAAELEEQVAERLKELVQDCDQGDPNDLKDKLYYEQRLGRMLNAFTASRLHALEPVRPLVDEDLIEFITRIPRRWREDKRLLRETFSAKHPVLDGIPYSRRDVLPVPEQFRRRLSSDAEMREFFIGELAGGLASRLAPLLDTTNFRESIAALVDNRPLPPLQHGLLSRLPVLWRLAKPPENRVSPMTALLRILQLNIYLKSLGH